MRNGTGEPLVSIDETQDAFIADILNDTNNPLKPVIHSILKTYSELNEKNKEVFEYILDEFIKNLGNGEK